MSRLYKPCLVLALSALVNGLLGGNQYSYERKYVGGKVNLTPDYSEFIVRFKTDIDKINIHAFAAAHDLKAESIRRGRIGFTRFSSNDLSRGQQFGQAVAAHPDVARLTPIFKDQHGSTLRFVPGRILVQFSEPTPAEESEELFEANNYTIVEKHVGHGFYTVMVPDGDDIFSSIMKLNALNVVVFSEPDYLVINCGSSVDADYDSEQWYMENSGSDPDINIEQAWDFNKGDSDVWLAPLEPAFNYDDHDELDSVYLTQYDYDFVNGDGTPLTGPYNHTDQVLKVL